MLSVVVLVHNRIAMSVECLAALAAATRRQVSCEVICVDNASTEDTAPLSEAGAPFDRFQLLTNARNESFAVANNRAAGASGGRWLLFLNNDVVVDAATITALLDAMRDEAVGAAGCRLVFPETGRVQHAGLVPTLWGFLSNYGVGAAAGDARFAGTHERPAVSGAALCVRRDRFDAAGGFDESYRWGYEDADLCFRLRELGHRVVCVGAGASEHHESATLRARRAPADLAHNYAIYRRRWAHWIDHRERAYADGLCARGIRRVVVFGAGVAAAGLFEGLQRAGIDTVAFATSAPDPRGTLAGRPIVTLDEVPELAFDRILAGSQFFFEVEARLRALDPDGEPLFPATWI